MVKPAPTNTQHIWPVMAHPGQSKISAMKLSRGQQAVLDHCRKETAAGRPVLVLEHSGSTFAGREFWNNLPGASPSTFHSLVKRGLLIIENNHFYYFNETDF